MATKEGSGRPQITTQQSVGNNIFVLRNIVAGSYYERAERPFGLPLVQWTVLRRVILNPEQSQADIAAACGLSSMNVSRAVAGLRQKGLVETTDDPRNQRRKMLTATELGESLGTDLAERERLLYEHVFSDLSSKEVEHLDAVVEKLIQRLATVPLPDAPPPSRDWHAALAAEVGQSNSTQLHQDAGVTA